MRNLLLIATFASLAACSISVGDHGEETPAEETTATNDVAKSEANATINDESGETNSQNQLEDLREDAKVVDDVKAEVQEIANAEPAVEDVIDDLIVAEEGLKNLNDSEATGESDSSQLSTQLAVCSKIGDAVVRLNIHAQNGLLTKSFAELMSKKLEAVSICQL